MAGRSLKTGIFISLSLTLWLRIILFIIGYSFASRFTSFPLTTAEMDFSKNIPHNTHDPWYIVVQPLHRFDALWYQEIAQHNYKNQSITTAFFPLYPWLIKSISSLVHSSYLVTAFFMNTILTVLAFFFFYGLAEKEYGEEIAKRTVVIYALFPMTFFLLVPYAEVLLLLLILISFYFAQQRKLLPSLLAACFAAITKPYGVALAIPLAYMFLQKASFKKKLINCFLLLSVLVSFIVILIYQDAQTKKNLSLFHSQGVWHTSLPFAWQPVIQELTLFVKNPFEIARDFYFITLIGVVSLLVYSRKRIKREYWLFSVVYFLIFYIFSFRQGILSSLSRYSLILFPLFMTIAKVRVHRFTEIIYLVSSVVLFVLFFYLLYLRIFCRIT